jgi:hypothetical protein
MVSKAIEPAATEVAMAVTGSIYFLPRSVILGNKSASSVSKGKPGFTEAFEAFWAELKTDANCCARCIIEGFSFFSFGFVRPMLSFPF